MVLSFARRNISITTRHSLHQSRKVEKSVCLMTTHQTLGHTIGNTFLAFHSSPKPRSSVCPVILLRRLCQATPHPWFHTFRGLFFWKYLMLRTFHGDFESTLFIYQCFCYQNKFLLGHYKSYKWPSQITCVRPACIAVVSEYLELKE